MVDLVFLADPVIDADAWAKTMGSDFAADALRDFSHAISDSAWNHEALKSILETWTDARGLKLGKTQAPIRVAVTGRTVGPPLFESIEVLGRAETQRRLGSALARLS